MRYTKPTEEGLAKLRTRYKTPNSLKTRLYNARDASQTPTRERRVCGLPLDQRGGGTKGFANHVKHNSAHKSGMQT